MNTDQNGNRRSSIKSVKNTSGGIQNSHQDESVSGPVTSTVISNVRGRSIISGGKDVIVNVNGSKQETPTDNIILNNLGTEQSTHRISNDKLPGVADDMKDESEIVSMPYTPAPPLEGVSLNPLQQPSGTSQNQRLSKD